MAFMKAEGVSQLPSFWAELGLSSQLRYPQGPTKKYSGNRQDWARRKGVDDK